MNKPTQTVKTFMHPSNDGLRYNEQYIDGIKHEQRHIDENRMDGFFFEECQQVDFIHSLGTVYLFNDGENLWGYVCAGYSWYRFNYVDLLTKAN